MKRPVHPPTEMPPPPLAPDRIEVDLGTWNCVLGRFRLRLVIRRSKIRWLVERAMRARNHHTEIAGGAIVLFAQRDATGSQERSA